VLETFLILLRGTVVLASTKLMLNPTPQIPATHMPRITQRLRHDTILVVRLDKLLRIVRIIISMARAKAMRSLTLLDLHISIIKTTSTQFRVHLKFNHQVTIILTKECTITRQLRSMPGSLILTTRRQRRRQNPATLPSNHSKPIGALSSAPPHMATSKATRINMPAIAHTHQPCIGGLKKSLQRRGYDWGFQDMRARSSVLHTSGLHLATSQLSSLDECTPPRLNA
jgi:hypothetical protein